MCPHKHIVNFDEAKEDDQVEAFKVVHASALDGHVLVIKCAARMYKVPSGSESMGNVPPHDGGCWEHEHFVLILGENYGRYFSQDG